MSIVSCFQLLLWSRTVPPARIQSRVLVEAEVLPFPLKCLHSQNRFLKRACYHAVPLQTPTAFSLPRSTLNAAGLKLPFLLHLRLACALLSFNPFFLVSSTCVYVHSPPSLPAAGERPVWVPTTTCIRSILTTRLPGYLYPLYSKSTVNIVDPNYYRANLFCKRLDYPKRNKTQEEMGSINVFTFAKHKTYAKTICSGTHKELRLSNM